MRRSQDKNAEGLPENDIYFYHSDHLSSTSYITDRNGNATQFIVYKPYGEVLLDEHAVSYDSPWKFNGKEWDSETGLYYYGARYYEPGVGIWYGVDALAEKYPSVGGYVYCVGNPVKFIDPDGNDGVVTISEDGTIVVQSTIIYLKSDLEEYNQNRTPYTIQTFQNDVDIYYNSQTFAIEIDDRKYVVQFDIKIVEADGEKNIDETTLPQGFSKMSFGPITFPEARSVAGETTGNSIRIVEPRFCAESEQTGATLSHEIGHTLGLKDTHEDTSGRLMSYSMTRNLKPEEVVTMLEQTIKSGFSTTTVGHHNKKIRKWIKDS